MKQKKNLNNHNENEHNVIDTHREKPNNAVFPPINGLDIHETSVNKAQNFKVKMTQPDNLDKKMKNTP